MQRRVSAHLKSVHSSEIALVLVWFALLQALRLTVSSVQMVLLQHFQKNFTTLSRRQQMFASTLNATDMILIQSTALFSSNQEFTDLPVTTSPAESLHQTGSTTHKQHLLSLHKNLIVLKYY